MKKAALSLFLTFILVAAAAYAQTPDLSGEWKLDPGRSDLGQMAAANPSITLTIRQEAAAIAVRKTILIMDREVIKSFRYALDGKESLNAGESLMDLRGKAALENGLLTIRSEQEGMTMTVSDGSEPEIDYFRYQSVEVFTLAPDGKTLTVVQDQQMQDGPRKLTYVFEKAAS